MCWGVHQSRVGKSGLLWVLLLLVCFCRELDRQAGRREGTEEDMLAYLQERYK
jgi:hypothetical protein